MASSPLPRCPAGLSVHELTLLWGSTLLCLSVLRLAVGLSLEQVAMALPGVYLMNLLTARLSWGLRAGAKVLWRDALTALAVTAGLLALHGR